MDHGAVFSKVATCVAMATVLCALLGAVGCVTRPQAVVSATGEVMRMTPFDADYKCSQFSCEP